MKALILKDKVVDLAETPFEVHPDLVWVDAPPEVEVGWLYDGGSFSPPPPQPPPQPQQPPPERQLLVTLAKYCLGRATAEELETAYTQVDKGVEVI